MEFKQKLAENLAGKLAHSKKSMFLNAGILGAGIVVGALASGLLVTVGVAVAGIGGYSLLREAGRARGYEQAKEDAAADERLTKTAELGKKHAKIHDRSMTVTLGSMMLFVAGIATAVAVPATAPLLVPAAKALLCVGAVGLGISEWHDGIKRASNASLHVAKELANPAPSVAAAPEAPAKDGWRTKLRSLFTRKASKEAAVEAPKPAPAPAAAPEAPKP